MEGHHCVPGQYRNILTNRRRTYGTHRECPIHAEKCRYDVKAQEVPIPTTTSTLPGDIVSPGKLAVASKTVEAVQKMRPSHDVSSLRSFLELCNVYRRFVPNFARIATPLTKKLKKDEAEKWDSLDEKETVAFEELKRRLAEPPILSLPRMHLTYIVDTDACDSQIGCELQQKHDDGTI